MESIVNVAGNQKNKLRKKNMAKKSEPEIDNELVYITKYAKDRRLQIITNDEFEVLKKFIQIANLKPMDLGQGVFGYDVSIKQARFVVKLKQ